MTYKVFAVYDLKAAVYMRPVFAVNAGSAMRDFGDETRNEKSMLSSHPEDFQLFEIAEYDDKTGAIKALSPVKFLVSAADYAAARGPVKIEEAIGGSK